MRNGLRSINRLDALREVQRPGLDDVRQLVELLDTGAAAGYFLRGDVSSAWLEPLIAAGAFQKYARVRTATNARWLILRELVAYLERFWKTSPDQVVHVLLSASTRDAWVVGRFMKIIAAMPEGHAAQLVSKVVEWSHARNPFVGADDIIKLMMRFAKSGHADAASSLLWLLVRPIGGTAGHDVVGVFPDDDLQQFVRGPFREFAGLLPEDALRVAQRALKHATRLLAGRHAHLHETTGEQASPTPDLSSWWRAAIEEGSGQDAFPGFEDALVDAVRDALDQVAARDTHQADEITRGYLAEPHSIFKRIALNALSERTAELALLARSVAVRKRLFWDYRLHHEYWRLVPRVFNELSPEQQRKLLKWIRDGRQTDDGDARKHFTRDRLYMLRDCELPREAREYLGMLLAEPDLGCPDHPEFLFYTTSRFGAVAPVSPAQLSEIEPSVFIDYLRDWRPSEGDRSLDSPSEDGLVHEIRAAVSANPSRYASVIDRAAELSPRRLNAFLDALWEGHRQGKQLTWGPILSLASSLVSETGPYAPPSETTAISDEQGTADWPRYVRNAITRLLRDGLDGRSDAMLLSSDLDAARDVLLRLVRDPHPSLEDERERERELREVSKPRDPDWFKFGIMTNRGEAADVLLRYAVRRANEVPQAERQLPRRLEPEVRGALDQLVSDPCRSIRAVLGSWLGNLYLLDRDWLGQNLQALLPSGEDDRLLWEAGWSAFLRFSILNEGLHQVLIPQYRRSAEVVAGRREDDDLLKGFCRNLAAAYSWGWDDIGDDAGLVCQLYRLAGDDAASEMAEALGHRVRGAKGEEGEVDAERTASEWERIERLLRWRIARAARNASQHQKELRAFASWFDAMLERTAAGTDTLRMVLDAITAVPLQHWQAKSVLQHLGAEASQHTMFVAHILRQLVRKSPRDAWMWEQDSINRILDSLFAASDSGALRDAVRVVEYLWRDGYWQHYECHKEQIARLAESS